MSHYILKTEPKPKLSHMDGLYDATESFWNSIQKSISTPKTNEGRKAKKYEQGLFY